MFFKKIKLLFIIIPFLLLLINCRSFKITKIDPNNPATGQFFDIYGFGFLTSGLKLFINNVQIEKDALEITEWTDTKIRVIMPDSYNNKAEISLKNNSEKYNKTILLNRSPGIEYSYPVKYRLNLDIIVYFNNLSQLNDTFMYVPQPILSDELLSIDIKETSIQPDYIQDNGLYVYDLSRIKEKKFVFDQTMDIITVYKKIDTNTQLKILPYEKETEFYKHYVQSEPNIIPEHYIIKRKVNQIIGDETNEIKKLKLLYKWTTDKMVMDYEPPSRSPLYSIEYGIGDCLSDTLLITTLVRSAGFPIRMNTGYIFYHTLDTGSLHFWEDVFIPGIGWFPMDISYGHQPDFLSTMEYFTPPSYFFGGNDGRKMAFSKGRIKLMKPDENNNLVLYKYLEFLQKPHVANIKTDQVYYNYYVKMKINVLEIKNLYDETK